MKSQVRRRSRPFLIEVSAIARDSRRPERHPLHNVHFAIDFRERMLAEDDVAGVAAKLTGAARLAPDMVDVCR
jgi:hypothetical protein